MKPKTSGLRAKTVRYRALCSGASNPMNKKTQTVHETNTHTQTQMRRNSRVNTQAIRQLVQSEENEVGGGSATDDPRTRLRAKLRGQKQLRNRITREDRDNLSSSVPPTSSIQAAAVTTDPQLNTREKLRFISQWCLMQLMGKHSDVLHCSTSLCLLFNIDLSTDSDWTNDTTLGSSLDVLVFKVNSGMYYETCDHMRGLKAMVATGRKKLSAEPDRLLYVFNPTEHIKGARADIEFDLEPIQYVARDISVSLVSNNESANFKLKPHHLPSIGQRPV